jgi:hypothetical protein
LKHIAPILDIMIQNGAKAKRTAECLGFGQEMYLSTSHPLFSLFSTGNTDAAKAAADKAAADAAKAAADKAAAKTAADKAATADDADNAAADAAKAAAAKAAAAKAAADKVAADKVAADAAAEAKAASDAAAKASADASISGGSNSTGNVQIMSPADPTAFNNRDTFFANNGSNSPIATPTPKVYSGDFSSIHSASALLFSLILMVALSHF